MLQRSAGIARDHLGQAKVEDLDAAVGSDPHVRRLEIAVDNPARVCAAHAVGDLVRHARGLGEAQRSPGDQVGQRRTVHQLHHDRRRSGELLEPMDGRDVRVVDRRQQRGLALEPGTTVGALARRFGQHLDRDVAAQPRIAGAVDLSHAAGAEQADDLVRADSGARCNRHGGHSTTWIRASS